MNQINKKSPEHFHIMVVEDEELIRDMIQQNIEWAGYECTIAESGMEALKILGGDSKKVDIIITDIRMPGLNGIELTKKSSSRQAETSYQKVKKRMPFNFAAMNTDNGGENEKDFSKRIQKYDIIHFYSREGMPTDNPRVERSHLTDEIEFYQQGNICKTFEKQKQENRKWEHIYNWIRPHQALGYLTPMEFYQLWKEKPNKAHQIVEKYQNYLKKQRRRLAKARKMKRKEQIEKLMKFIDAKLKDDQENNNSDKVSSNKKVNLNTCKLELINCELCSWG